MQRCESCGGRNAAHSRNCTRCGGALGGVPLQAQASGDTDAFPVVPEITPDGLVDRAAADLADDRVNEAIEGCRRALALDPSHIEAYAVLGMAYEQKGEHALALDAYESVLDFDPERAVERQKVQLLRLRLRDEPAPLPPPRPRWQDFLRTHKPIVVGVSAFLLVFIIGSIALVSAGKRSETVTAQQEYEREMLLGEQAMVEGRYGDARVHFARAWHSRGDDPTAQSRYQEAHRLAEHQGSYPGATAQLPKYIGGTGSNPFRPVPIGGPTPEELAAAAAADATATLSDIPDLPPPTAAMPPRAVDVVGGRSRTQTSPLPAGADTMPSPTGTAPGTGGPIAPRQTAPTETATTTPAPVETAPDTTPRAPRGEITIWASEKQPQATSRQPAAEPATPPAPRGDALRDRARSLANQGRTQEAIQAYTQAAGAYREQARTDPATAAASRSAADACEAQANYLRSQ